MLKHETNRGTRIYYCEDKDGNEIKYQEKEWGLEYSKSYSFNKNKNVFNQGIVNPGIGYRFDFDEGGIHEGSVETLVIWLNQRAGVFGYNDGMTLIQKIVSVIALHTGSMRKQLWADDVPMPDKYDEEKHSDYFFYSDDDEDQWGDAAKMLCVDIFSLLSEVKISELLKLVGLEKDDIVSKEDIKTPFPSLKYELEMDDFIKVYNEMFEDDLDDAGTED